MGLNEGEWLRNHLGYQLQMTNLRLMDRVRAALQPGDLTPAKLTALTLIRDNPGCDQSALGRALSINRSSAMKIATALADRGLVERRPGRDLRTNALHVTDAGAAALAEMTGALDRIEADFARPLTEAEAAQLMRLLVKLRGRTPR